MSATATLTNCTGGGIQSFPAITIKNSIVSGNTAAYHPDLYLSNFYYAGDHNYIGGDAKLGPLQSNGGLTPTMLPQAGSPVIDAGTNVGAPDTDQRGVARPIDDPAVANATNGIDIGAFEAGDHTAPPVITFTTLQQNHQRQLLLLR